MIIYIAELNGVLHGVYKTREEAVAWVYDHMPEEGAVEELDDSKLFQYDSCGDYRNCKAGRQHWFMFTRVTSKEGNTALVFEHYKITVVKVKEGQ
tara:strand:- start:204 stop:488 length:285 start_codon:yes stop_codon:yes gene_type:complete